MKALILCVSLTACWLTLAAPGAVPASPAPKPVAQPRSEPLQGVWQQVDVRGQYLSSGLTLAFDGQQLTMGRDSGETDVVRFTTTSNTTQSGELDLDLPEGRALGLYELTAGTLRLTLADCGGERPTDFRQHRVAEFRRLPTR